MSGTEHRSGVVLSDAEREAVDLVVSASRRELLAALATLPEYQRNAIRWLAQTVRRDRVGRP